MTALLVAPLVDPTCVAPIYAVEKADEQDQVESALVVREATTVVTEDLRSGRRALVAKNRCPLPLRT